MKSGGSTPTNPTEPILLDYCDSKVDNVEHIHIETLPGYTVYEIVVSYSDLDAKSASPAGERYALAWSVEEKPSEENLLWYDLNADGIVDDQDQGILKNNSITAKKSPQTYVIGDVTKDGTINDADIQAVMANRNKKADWRVDSVAVANPVVDGAVN